MLTLCTSITKQPYPKEHAVYGALNILLISIPATFPHLPAYFTITCSASIALARYTSGAFQLMAISLEA